MLTSTLLLLFTAPANDAWLERLDFPKVSKVDLNLEVGDEDLGIESIDLGFPDDPVERVQEAFERVQDGDRSSLTLHQAISGIIALRDTENCKKVMPACLQAYARELKESPGDTDLRLRFIRVLIRCGTATKDDRFFQDAEGQVDQLAEAEPDSWRWRMEYSKVQFARVMFLGGTDSDLSWLEGAVEASAEAIRLAPGEVEPRWRHFYARNLVILRAGAKGDGPGAFSEPWVELGGLADELSLQAERMGEPMLGVVGRSFWAIAQMGVIMTELEGGSAGASAEDQGVQERLDDLRGTLESIPEGSLRSGAVRAWWGLAALFAPPEQVEGGMGAAIELGLSRSDAHTIALMALHRRDLAEGAAAVALELAQCAEGDTAWRVLTTYRHELGDHQGALEAQAKIDRVDPTLRLARAQLRLHTGDLEAARDELKILVGEVAGMPQAGQVGHAYGVALALIGDHPGAKLQLSLASRLLGEEEGAGARATLEDLR